MDDEKLQKLGNAQGFVAALDQSGGSTPKALRLYGISEDSYSGEDEMFDLVHQMRARIMTSPAFGGDRILASILFEKTMRETIEGSGTAEYLWSEKNVVPILKVDKGLQEESDGVQIMKPIPGLDDLCSEALSHGVAGTKMRSVVKMADPGGIKAILDQQFEVGLQILDAGLMPILEPEIDIHSPQKAEAEELLAAGIIDRLANLRDDQQLMFKLTLPNEDNFYSELVDHPRVLRVVALSGGYTREEANDLLARNNGVVASFSRALTEGLTAQQSDEEFNSTLDSSIASIFEASIT